MSLSTQVQNPPKVAIIGGGLAGIAAAVALTERKVPVELFEARRFLGGRAGSFIDSETEGWIDHCQHASLGCCTNMNHFCKTVGIAQEFKVDRQLHFIASDGTPYEFSGRSYLPAPLHLLPSFIKFGYLSLKERISIARALFKLARVSPTKARSLGTFDRWLADNHQTPRAIEQFWVIILASALSESLDRINVAAARKIFVDIFMTNRIGYELRLPKVHLGELYQKIQQWLTARNSKVHLSSPIKQIAKQDGCSNQFTLTTKNSDHQNFDFVIPAVPWKHVADLFDGRLLTELPELSQASKLEPAPISAIHLWYDRKITVLPHAVILGKLSQWLFYHGEHKPLSTSTETGHYYQIVISAAREVIGQDRDQVVAKICQELAEIFPAAKQSQLLHSKLLTQRESVFSPTVESENYRLPQTTSLPNIMLAGDWTKTGWPATMESAVRSGNLAAEALLEQLGRPEKILQDDLPRNWLVRCLIK